MGKFFTIEELSASRKAKQNKIDNTPPEEIRKHLEELIAALDPIRKEGGSAIRVTSGYRCEALNKLVNGSKTSAHKCGYAVDLVPVKGTPKDLYYFMLGYLDQRDALGDQLIIESSKTGSWVHFGLKSCSGKQRRQYFRLDVK